MNELFTIFMNKFMEYLPYLSLINDIIILILIIVLFKSFRPCKPYDANELEARVTKLENKNFIPTDLVVNMDISYRKRLDALEEKTKNIDTIMQLNNLKNRIENLEQKLLDE